MVVVVVVVDVATAAAATSLTEVDSKYTAGGTFTTNRSSVCLGILWGLCSKWACSPKQVKHILRGWRAICIYILNIYEYKKCDKNNNEATVCGVFYVAYWAR